MRSVGPGSWPNILGRLQLDAAVMDGATLQTGAVGALEGFAHPLGIARAVLTRLPHEILVGAGASRFAAEIGAEPTGDNPPEVDQAWRGVLEREGASAAALQADPTLPLADLVRAATDPERVRDTTVYLAQDATGNICSGVSTSGWAWKYPGRLGDSPIIGAGSYAGLPLRCRGLHPYGRDDDPGRHGPRGCPVPQDGPQPRRRSGRGRP